MSKLIFMSCLFSGLLILIITSFKKADEDYSITIDIYPAMAIVEHTTYTIKGNNHQANVNHYSVVGLDFDKLVKDKTYIQLMAREQIDTAPLVRNKWAKKWDSLKKIYSITSNKNIAVTVNEFSLYFKQIDSILHSPETTLLYKSPKYTYVMDGYSVSFYINTNGKIRKFSVSNPSDYYAAPLYHFLISSWQFFDPQRKQQNK